MAINLNRTTVKRGPGRPSNAERAARLEAQREAAAQNAALRSAGVDPLSNVTDETILEFIGRADPLYEDLLVAKDRFREAQERYRALLKRAEAANVIELDWLMKTKRQDIHEVDRQIAARNRLAALARLPIGSQLGFLPGQMQVTVASVVDEIKLAEQKIMEGITTPQPKPAPEPEAPHEQPPEPPEPLPPAAVQYADPLDKAISSDTNLEEAKAYAQGGRARMFGRTIESNPMPSGSDLARVWARGWQDKDVGEKARV